MCNTPFKNRFLNQYEFKKKKTTIKIIYIKKYIEINKNKLSRPSDFVLEFNAIYILVVDCSTYTTTVSLYQQLSTP